MQTETRVDFLDRIGYGYVKLEEDGIISPVLTVECEYKKSLHFGDEFAVLPEIMEFKGIRLVIRYTFTLAGETVATGKTSHCFLTPEGRPIALKHQFPEFDAVLKGLVKS